MKRGKPVASWSEPDTWRQASLAHAKQEGRSIIPWKHFIVALGMVGGGITWEWSDADPSKRASVPMLVGIILTLFGFFVVMAWIYYRLNRTTKTTLYERGILHGSLSKKRWMPWTEIECFYLEEDAIGPHRFRFLSWTCLGDDEEEFSVLSDDVDEEVIVSIFEKHNIEQVSASDGDKQSV